MLIRLQCIQIGDNSVSAPLEQNEVLPYQPVYALLQFLRHCNFSFSRLLTTQGHILGLISISCRQLSFWSWSPSHHLQNEIIRSRIKL